MKKTLGIHVGNSAKILRENLRGGCPPKLLQRNCIITLPKLDGGAPQKKLQRSALQMWGKPRQNATGKWHSGTSHRRSNICRRKFCIEEPPEAPPRGFLISSKQPASDFAYQFTITLPASCRDFMVIDRIQTQNATRSQDRLVRASSTVRLFVRWIQSAAGS